MNVVFTGPAFDGNGQSVLRAHLAAACLSNGINVQPCVIGSTTALIASRQDTVKARGAKSRGVEVLSYPQFISKHLHGVEIARGGIPSKYTDKIVLDLLVPDFTASYGLAPENIL